MDDGSMTAKPMGIVEPRIKKEKAPDKAGNPSFNCEEIDSWFA